MADYGRKLIIELKRMRARAISHKYYTKQIKRLRFRNHIIKCNIGRERVEIHFSELFIREMLFNVIVGSYIHYYKKWHELVRILKNV